MDLEKLKVIRGWSIPTNLHELRRFIGMCAYYKCFIDKFSYIARSFHDLTKNNVKERENDSFEI